MEQDFPGLFSDEPADPLDATESEHVRSDSPKVPEHEILAATEPAKASGQEHGKSPAPVQKPSKTNPELREPRPESIVNQPDPPESRPTSSLWDEEDFFQIESALPDVY